LYYSTISKAKGRDERRKGLFQEDEALEESGESQNRSYKGYFEEDGAVHTARIESITTKEKKGKHKWTDKGSI
jgi:hypothetical protein